MIFKFIRVWLFIAIILNCSKPWAKPLLITTSPDLQWLAQQLVSDRIEVKSFLSGNEDMHHMDALPSFVLKAANADIVCFMGLGLELSWLPRVLTKSGNSKVQIGGSGHCDASQFIKVLEKFESKIDRSMGDVHPEGNPHYQLSPAQMIQAARAIVVVLKSNFPESEVHFEKNFLDLKNQLEGLSAEIKGMFDSSAKKLKFMEYHKDFSYFLDEFSLESAGAIEELPGVPPSAAFLARRAKSAQELKVNLVLATKLHPESHLKKFEALSGVPYLKLETTLTDEGLKLGYPHLMKSMVGEILEKVE